MEKRICENSGLKLSVIGTGCWAFGGGEYWGEQNQNDVNEVVRASVDLGINYFDTAEVYNEGRSEISLGKAIKGIPRDKIVIGTKVSPSNCYRDVMIEHCNESLKRLKTDYIDLYMIHWPIHAHSIRHFSSDKQIIENPPQIEEAWETMELLKKEGKIRHAGVSNFSFSRLKDLALDKVAVNELPYNLLCRAIEYDTLSVCEKKGIGVIGYMALMQGILADIYPTLDDVPVWRRRTRHFNSRSNSECRHGEKGAEEETTAVLDGIRRICRETGLSMSELSIKWILENSSIACTIVGSRNLKQFSENVKAAGNPLAKDVKEELDNITLPLMEKLGNHFDYYESAQNDRTR